MTATIEPTIPAHRPVRKRLVAVVLAASLLLGGCTLFSSGMYTVISENFGTRRTAVINKGVVGYLYQQLWNVGAARVADGISAQMYWPASLVLNAPWPYQTAADYTRTHPSDVSGAIVAAASDWSSCLAFTFLPPYNWTIKHQGCH